MKIVKVRRVNSNVVSIPREFEADGYVPGASVLVEELAGGGLLRIRADQQGSRMDSRCRRTQVSEHGEALAILAQDKDRPGS